MPQYIQPGQAARFIKNNRTQKKQARRMDDHRQEIEDEQQNEKLYVV